MKKWLIVNEIAILTYMCINCICNQVFDIVYITLATLVYIALKITYLCISKNKILYKKIVLTIILLYLFITYTNISYFYAFLVPLNLYILVNLFTNRHIYFIVLTTVITIFVNSEIRLNFIFVCTMSFFYLLLLKLSYNKVTKLTLELDTLRKSNYTMTLQQSKNLSYMNELKKISQLEERNKISQEIHDSVGHTLAGSIMQLEASKLLLASDPSKSETLISNTITTLKSGMEKIRLTLRDIKPAPQELGINNLKLLINEFEKSQKLSILLHYTESIDIITFLQWKIITANVKECITNTIKYSNATKVNVKIETLNKYIKIEVKDNGIGFKSLIKGLGILGIEERTHHINGKVIIDGSDGFSLITLLPK